MRDPQGHLQSDTPSPVKPVHTVVDLICLYYSLESIVATLQVCSRLYFLLVDHQLQKEKCQTSLVRREYLHSKMMH